MNDQGVLYVADDDGRNVLYTSQLVTLPDGTTIAHESQGGTLSSVTAVEHGSWFLEIAHLGDGPTGGELVMTATPQDGGGSYVAVGDLWTADTPTHVPLTWPVAVDMALGLLGPGTTLIAPDLTKDELEAFHQRLLGVLHG